MSKFKVGDKARFVRGIGIKQHWIDAYGYLLGRECTIIAVPALPRSLVPCDCTIIIDGDNGYIHISFDSLEPLQKRPELGTIEELKMITGGWTPGHVTKRKVNS